MCLTVTCHLHFWQNDRDLLGATAVTRGSNGYQNKSQHRKLTLEKRILPPLLCPARLEPATFRSRVRRSATELTPLPAECKVDLSTGSCHFAPHGSFAWFAHFCHGFTYFAIAVSCCQCTSSCMADSLNIKCEVKGRLAQW